MFGIRDNGAAHWPGVSKLMEEAGEVVQVCGKLVETGGKVEHWDGSNLKQRLEEEIGDLLAAIEFARHHCELDEMAIQRRARIKVARFDEWHLEGRQCKP